MTVPKEATTPDMLRLAVAAVLEADKEFRANMPPEWEGDPLIDEIDGLRRVFSSTPPIAGEGKVKNARSIITNTIGFNFEPGELQTVNADDLLRLAEALTVPSDRIEGEVVGNKFVASSWPKPRFSNPNFLTGLLADMESDTKKEPTDE